MEPQLSTGSRRRRSHRRRRRRDNRSSSAGWCATHILLMDLLARVGKMANEIPPSLALKRNGVSTFVSSPLTRRATATATADADDVRVVPRWILVSWLSWRRTNVNSVWPWSERVENNELTHFFGAHSWRCSSDVRTLCPDGRMRRQGLEASEPLDERSGTCTHQQPQPPKRPQCWEMVLSFIIMIIMITTTTATTAIIIIITVIIFIPFVGLVPLARANWTRSNWPRRTHRS